MNDEQLNDIVNQVKNAIEPDVEDQRGMKLNSLKFTKFLTEDEKIMYDGDVKKREAPMTAQLRKQNDILLQQGELTRQALISEGEKIRQHQTTTITTSNEELKYLINSITFTPTINNNVRSIIIPEGKNQDINVSVRGLGMNADQRRQLREIITTETSSDYASIVDKIAGDEIKTTDAHDILIALSSLGLSTFVPIPVPVMNNLLQMASRASGFGEWFERSFNSQTVGDRVVYTNNQDTIKSEVIGHLTISELEGKTEREGKSTDIPQVINTQGVSMDLQVDRNAQAQAQEQSDSNRRAEYTKQKKITKAQRGPNGRFVKNSVLIGATVGAGIGAGIGGTAVSTVMTGAAGGIVGLFAPTIGTALSNIGSEVSTNVGDNGILKTNLEEKRRILKQSKDMVQTLINANIDNGELITIDDIAMYRKQAKVDKAQNEYDKALLDLKTAENKVNRASKVISGGSIISGAGLVAYNTLKDNSNVETTMTDTVVSDSSKALVVADNTKTGNIKEVAINLKEKLKGYIYPESNERKIELPAGIYSQQQGKEFDTTMPNMARGMLRPKFIMPDADILQPSNQELAADALEFAMFDFVEPSSEGAEGTNQTNILKAFQKENENIRYRGAGVVVNSLFNNDANDLTREQITKMFLGPPIPPMVFTEIQQNLSEYEVNQFDVNNELTAVEFFSPYNNFTDVNPGLNENMTLLFDIVP